MSCALPPRLLLIADVLWQSAYYKVRFSRPTRERLLTQFISIDRKAKIESGQRENSFH